MGGKGVMDGAASFRIIVLCKIQIRIVLQNQERADQFSVVGFIGNTCFLIKDQRAGYDILRHLFLFLARNHLAHLERHIAHLKGMGVFILF